MSIKYGVVDRKGNPVIMKGNDDYYNVWVSNDVELPLCVGQFEYVKELVKIL